MATIDVPVTSTGQERMTLGRSYSLGTIAAVIIGAVAVLALVALLT